jgi:hypothetical protein
MLKFFVGAFAIAGLVAASGPIIIHLLNRRRFRVIDWAAMDFLRRAMQRNRRAVQMRDLIVLFLRCLAVALFGAALARPFLSGVSGSSMWGVVGTAVALMAAIGAATWAILTPRKSLRPVAILTCLIATGLTGFGLFDMLREVDVDAKDAFASRQPVHAVLVVDNSMSMGYESLDGTLLDQAKARAAEFIDALPAESQVHVIALCGGDDVGVSSAYRSKTDARAALDRLRVVDRVGRASFGMELAVQACARVPELTAKRVVFLSDQQTNLWAGGAAKQQIKNVADLQLVSVAPKEIENVWVSSFAVRDGIADTEIPTEFLATIDHSGEAPLANVQVSLSIDGVEVASKIVDLEPGQAREITFIQRLDSVTDTAELIDGLGKSAYLKATVEVSVEGGVGDRLSRDNKRHLVVPVVAGLPVVFIDQYGETEDLDRNEVGETYRLRRLLAPRSSRDEESNRQLVNVKHTTIDRVDQTLLTSARLVIVAGIESPGESVAVLRQYVEQGGTVIIAAGADFDAMKWNEDAWKDGAGLLPAPFLEEPLGQLPEVAVNTLEPFFLNFQSLQHDFFLIEGEDRQRLQDLYREPYFFKAVALDTDSAIQDLLIAKETIRITEAREFIAESEKRLIEWEQLERQGNLSDDDEAERLADQERRHELQPQWLVWQNVDRQKKIEETSAADLAVQSTMRVLGKYTNNDRPFLAERRIGAGRVFVVTTGLYSSWNSLTGTNAILMFDRMFRQLLKETLPVRNYETGDTVSLPAQKSDQVRWEATGPDETKHALPVEALSSSRFGVIVRNTMIQGQYQVASFTVSRDKTDNKDGTPSVTIPLAFNCPSDESELSTLDSLSFQERMGEGKYRWLEGDETISIEGSQVRGHDIWKSIIIIVIVLLLLEMAILGWPNRKAESPTSA